jgi:hypothetical protein
VPTFEEVMALASLPEDTLPLCLAGKLVAEVADLQRQFAEAPPPSNLGERSPASVLAERIAEVAERMKAATVDFKLKAMDGKKWDAHYAILPLKAKDESAEDYAPRKFAWVAELVSLTCVDPPMSAGQVAELVDRLHGSAWDKLSNTCWALNAGDVEVPNFVSVSPPTPVFSETSKPPSKPAGPTANGKVASRQKRQSTSTTTGTVSSAA